MKWATRRGLHIDRAACVWLIRRFLDADAEFVFVGDPDEIPIGATPFDIRGVRYSHHEGDCSFETFLRAHALEDPALWWIARIVHEADLEDERYHAPEAAGLDTALRGLSLVCDDDQLLEVTTPIFDGLYALGRRRSRLDVPTR